MCAAMVVALLFTLAMTARVDNSGGDNHLSLLTAQALLETGSPRLDPYVARCGKDSIIAGSYGAYLYYQKHHYYYFPIGTPLLSIPLVAAGKVVGADMVRSADVRAWRRWYSGFSMVALLGIFFAMARLYVRDRVAIWLALITVLGTTAASTMGTGNWSHNAATLCIATLIYWMAVHARRGNLPVHGAWIGVVAFLAYLCRPSSVAWVLPILLYAGWAAPARMRWAVLSIAVLAAAFVAWSKAEYGLWLPPYYAPQRLTGSTEFSDAFWGNWISPARGILCFSPLICLGLLTVWLPDMRRQRLVWLLSLGFVFQWVLISRFPHWWGGWSFGPRLQTESIPGLALLTLVGGLAIWEKVHARALRIVFTGLAVILAAWGILVHTVQGMYFPAVMSWNGTIDIVPEHYIWEWRYPQFLAGFQPERITLYRSNYRLRLAAQLQDVPQGSQLYCPGDAADFPMLRKVCREFNADKTLGNVFLFPDFHLRQEGRPLYATLFGRNQLQKDHPELKAVPEREYLDLGAALKAREPNVTYLLSNGLTPASLSAASKAYLDSAGLTLPATGERFGLMAKFHQGKLVWAEWSADKTIRKHEFLGEQQAFMTVVPSNPHSHPHFKLGPAVMTDYAASSYLLQVSGGGTIDVLGLELNHADSEASATFRME